MAKRLTKADQARDVSSLRKVIRLPTAKTIKDLAASVAGYRRKSGENSERISKLYAAAVKHGHVHKGAATLCDRFERMEEGKRAVMLAHFDHYRELRGLDKIRQGALDLEAKGKAAPKGKERGTQVDLEELTGAEDRQIAREAAVVADAAVAAMEPPRAETLVDPASLPTRDEVKAAADRAEQLSTARSTLPLN